MSSAPVCAWSRCRVFSNIVSRARTGEARFTAPGSIATSGLALAVRRARGSVGGSTDSSEPEAAVSVTRADRSLGALRPVALTLSFALLLLVAAAGPSAAKPGLGPRGWAPGDLPISLSSAVVTTLLWTAYLLGGLAVALGLWRGSSQDRGWSGSWRWARTGNLRWLRDHPWLLPLTLGALALLTAPIGSADHINYAAYGRISAQGGDPYLVPPITWAGGTDPVTSAVEPLWTMTPSVYGPFLDGAADPEPPLSVRTTCDRPCGCGSQRSWEPG